MPLEIVRNDITQMKVDAIVNAANTALLGGGGVDGAIHRAAGPQLLEECAALGGCPTGSAKVTKGYKLPCRYVIHTVGPVWQDGRQGEPELLADCYRNSLMLVKELHCETVAFPLISSGAYGCPKAQALKTAVDVIGDFLLTNDMTVYLVVFDKSTFQISSKLFSDISQYIDDVYVDQHMIERTLQDKRSQSAMLPHCGNFAAPPAAYAKPLASEAFPAAMEAMDVSEAQVLSDDALTNLLEQLDESFAQALLRLIDQRGMTDVECYKKANVDRKLFSKIRKDPHYHPSKATTLAFAVSLRLSLPETRALLSKAGFALSHSSKFDIIVEYCIQNHMWDVHEINEVLFEFDQPLLGNV